MKDVRKSEKRCMFQYQSDLLRLRYCQRAKDSDSAISLRKGDCSRGTNSEATCRSVEGREIVRVAERYDVDTLCFLVVVKQWTSRRSCHTKYSRVLPTSSILFTPADNNVMGVLESSVRSAETSRAVNCITFQVRVVQKSTINILFSPLR